MAELSRKNGTMPPAGLARAIIQLVREAGGDDLANQPGAFSCSREEISEDDVLLLEAASRVVLDGARGCLSGQLDRIDGSDRMPSLVKPTQSPGRWGDEPVDLPTGLQFFNGLGGLRPPTATNTAC